MSSSTQNVEEGLLLVDARQRVIFINEAARGLLKVQYGVGRKLSDRSKIEENAANPQRIEIVRSIGYRFEG